MTVKEGIELLSYGTDYKAISARTGKKLFDSLNSEKHKARFYDWKLADNPFFPELKVSKNAILDSVEWCKPIIVMWVYDPTEVQE